MRTERHNDMSKQAQRTTAEDAHAPAMRLLHDLGQVIGDRDGITDALLRTIDEHPRDHQHIILSALAWTFAEHARLDPEWKADR